MIKPNIPKHNKDIIEFCKKHHVARLSLFGSILGDKFKKSSDVDFLVQFEKKHVPTLIGIIDMEEELSQIIGHKVDLRTPNELSRYFREEVLSQAKLIYGSR